MSQPVLSGEQLQASVTDDGVLRIVNDPGFTTDNPDGAPYRWPYLVNDDGTVFGTEKPLRELWDVAAWMTRDFLKTWGPHLEPGNYRLRVYAGTLFKGWGDTPEDYVEWGYTDQGRNPSGIIRRNEVVFTVPGNTPPPEPPPPAYPFDVHAIAEMRANVQAEEDMARITYARWVKEHANEYRRAEEYKTLVLQGRSASPPSLGTHRGRAVVGRLQLIALAGP